jgi:hypothetical protein
MSRQTIEEGLSMPESNWPAWWNFELELCAHLQDRMIDRGFSEADLRLMMEDADGLRVGSRVGRWVIATTHLGDAWEVVVEPDLVRPLTLVVEVVVEVLVQYHQDFSPLVFYLIYYISK